MARPTTNVNILLDDEHAAKLRRLAERAHADPGTIARSLLSSAIDPDARTVTEILDGIPGAFERAERGSAVAAAGFGVHLEDL
ncbi:MAG: hypothetical protein WEG56_07050 [Chloroflexota bacterium]